MHNLNEQLFFLINQGVGQSHLLDNVFIFISDTLVKLLVGFSIVWFALIPFKTKDPVERLRGFGRFGLFIFSLISMRVIVEAIKMIVAFPRPQELLYGVQALSSFGSFDSFPSAHTAFAFTIATFVYHYSKNTGVMLFFLAVLVGVSRIFVGVHYPLDVIFGGIIGVLVPLMIFSFIKRYKS